MPLEDSPETFFQRFAPCRIELRSLPVPAGYPLLELETPEGLLRAMDRGAPPAPRGPVELVLHAVARRFGPAEGPPAIVALAGGRHRFVGRVQAALEEGWYCFSTAVPLVVYSATPLPPSTLLWVESEPPLFAYRP